VVPEGSMIRSEDVRKRLQMGNVVEDIRQYQRKWLEHVECLSPECITDLSKVSLKAGLLHNGNEKVPIPIALQVKETYESMSHILNIGGSYVVI
jgi:hypothetical protein